MGLKELFNNPQLLAAREQFEVFDHFVSFTDADLWTVAVAGTGTAAHEGPGRSRIKLFGTADNDPAVIATTNELFKFTAGKAIAGEARINFTDVNTDDGAVGFGFADALAATTLADTTSAVTATDAALIYKVKNSTVWAFHTEINGTAVATTSSTTAGGTDDQVLRIEIIPVSTTVLEARPFVDGVQLKDTNGVKIKHNITLGTATDLDFGVILKDGHANDFTCYVDYLHAAQVI
jgi:hypothetical protein